MDSLPGTYVNRVFIAGNYNYMPIIRQIQGIVKRTGMEPIVAYDFNVPESEIHDACIRLLRNCKYSLFEETDPAGELMELEVAAKETVAFVVYQIRDPSKKEPPGQLSSMVTTLKLPMFGYATFLDLKSLIMKIFPAIKNDPIATWADLLRIVWLPEKFRSTLIDSFGKFIRAEEIRTAGRVSRSQAAARIPKDQEFPAAIDRQKLLGSISIKEPPADHLVAKNFSKETRRITYRPEGGPPKTLDLKIRNVVTHPSQKSFGDLHACEVALVFPCPTCSRPISHTYSVQRRDKYSSWVRVRCPDDHRFILYKALEYVIDWPETRPRSFDVRGIAPRVRRRRQSL